MRSRLLIPFLVAAGVAHAVVARAQANRASAYVVVRVVDQTAAPVSGAEVSLIHGVAAVVAHTTTTNAGVARLGIARTDSPIQVTVRKIGYERGYSFVTLNDADSAAITVALVPAVASLEAVKVTAEQDVLRKSYHLTAEDIENAPRVILEGTDIFKLRPDMLNSRGGPAACANPYTHHDGWIENVWINGRRITLPILSPTVRQTERGLLLVEKPPRPDPLHSRRLPPPTPVSPHVDTVVSILESVKPEHIAEVEYHDCFAKPMERNFTEMAVFITLKPGIAYRDGVGSYVTNEQSLKTVAPGQEKAVGEKVTAAATLPADTTTTTVDLPAYRFRLLGIYDEETGEPIPNVEVSDVITGARSQTSKTGTVSLFFLPDGGSLVRLRLLGYGMQTLTVPISPRDTTPITVVMSRVNALAAVVVNDSAASAHGLSSKTAAFEERRKAGFGYFCSRSAQSRRTSKIVVDGVQANLAGALALSSTSAVLAHDF